MTPWRDGTSHVALQPLELLEKLAALTPRPYVNLIVYHGVLAPNANWRGEVVDFGRPQVEKASSAAFLSVGHLATTSWWPAASSHLCSRTTDLARMKRPL